MPAKNKTYTGLRTGKYRLKLLLMLICSHILFCNIYLFPSPISVFPGEMLYE
jgi:hypothetical protein